MLMWMTLFDSFGTAKGGFINFRIKRKEKKKRCRKVVDCWLLVGLLIVGCWLLVVGCWLLVVGC
jgi:hypothetical protein